ncbi:Sjogren's syndrome/scleroderma autoantigen 1 family protein [Haloplanus natans]|uniref:Sjogren's syndrome/scleroderma autoantigen 1 family protein n=1 Tax=Haloplanus natans TaxID=376171 RepID=UPI0006778EA3|nr:Sjogren's syndrome/scleroderma autoantigen 1 family protein [Haloplanus natans]
MSGFDEEAERERLREKYERDQEKRASTQRMSELLLKGATMTNSHCDTCGDPIFRYDGQEFCPTCQTAGEEAAERDAEAETTASEEVTEPETAADTADAAADDTTPAPEAAGRPVQPGTADERMTVTSDGRIRDAGAEPTASRPSASADGSLDEARASLSRTLLRYARAAEEADDPRRATEFLSAAREAAETLAALDFQR